MVTKSTESGSGKVRSGKDFPFSQAREDEKKSPLFDFFSPMKNTVFYNTQHSPLGSFASFTLGAKGAKGGFGLELGKPADQNVFVGVESEGVARCLPFCEFVEDSESARFDVEAHGVERDVKLKPFAEKEISRDLTPGRDTWRAGALEFTIHTPVMSAPDPDKADTELLKLAYVPALAVELTVDNREGKSPKRAFFGFLANDLYRGMRQLGHTHDLTGLACGDFLTIASDSRGVVVSQGFAAEDALSEKLAFNRDFGIGNTGLLIGNVPAGRKVTFRYVVCFHRAGIVTTGMPASYFYTRFFPTLESVASYALENFPALAKRGQAFDRKFERAPLNAARKFMLAQALHSYYGSTEFLVAEKRPMWIVNEGEYRMMNTFDLTVDQLFLEMRLNPWTVRNELEWFERRYSYTDSAYLPGLQHAYAGGITFTHDMGVANHFSRPGFSVYEKAGLKGCFSHMSHEELVNWVVCALVYEKQNKEKSWLKSTLPVFHKVLESLVNRDHPDPEKRDGVMSLDSSRCAGGSEITTYDSLDVSLGQARNNLYLAVKCWGSYVGLADLFTRQGDKKRAALCLDQAAKAASTVIAAADHKGLLPAVLHEDVQSRIIPAVEGLIIPWELGLKDAVSETGPYSLFIQTLKKHLLGVLKKGVCLFPDGAWKISSTSDNSWLSKVYLCQHVAEDVLGCVPTSRMADADERHADWLLNEENSYWAWSDQIVRGVAKGSKYYPRGVTSILWLD